MNKVFKISRCRGVTLMDVIVAMGLLALIVTIVLQFVVRMRERSSDVPCASNLRQIGQAIVMYSWGNRGSSFPRTLYKVGAPPTFFTGEACSDPFGGPGTVGTPPQVNDVTAALFLLIRTQDLSPKIFICPTTTLEFEDFGGSTALKRSNFRNTRDTLGYSFANPYPDQAAIAAGYKWDSTRSSNFAIAGEMNPGGEIFRTLKRQSSAKEMVRGNSRNHGGSGQNVLYGDGHVSWEQTPFVGVDGDNIYTVSDGPGGDGTSAMVEGIPTWRDDSVLMPVAMSDPGVAGPFTRERGALYGVIGGCVVLFLVMLMVVARLRRRGRVA